MIYVECFTIAHAGQAGKIALQNYDAERNITPALPPIDVVPDLSLFADNGLGVAAFEDGKMVGFLCGIGPFKNAFGSTDAVIVFSPMHANGTIEDNRAKIYALMYQAVGEKWANAGASSHAVCLYAHDTAGQEQFFRYGFGLRCIDAIRGMEEIPSPSCAEYNFTELNPDEFPQILPLDHMLDKHMAASPCFILRPSHSEASFIKQLEHFQSIIMAAKKDARIVAYLRAELDGETFICNEPGYLHVKGAFCLPEYRGQGVCQNLLSLLVQKLKAKGYTRLGVDFESINPTACGFWLKYFSAYTHSVVRRIDEHCLKQQI